MLQSPHLRAGRAVLVRLSVALAACAAAAAIRPASAGAHVSPGVLLDQRLSTWPLVVSVFYAISVVLVVAAAVTAPRRAPERLLAMGVVGFLVATFTLPALGVFQRGFVLSALAATAARACVTLALGCGLGVALLAGPSLVSSLRRTHTTGTADTS